MTPQSVLAYLERAEAREEDTGYRDSYRLAWIVTHLSCQDHPFPLLQAFYTIYGVSPEKLPEKLRQRRLAQLGRYYGLFWGELPAELWGVPKKLPQSIRKESVPEQADSPRFKFPSA